MDTFNIIVQVISALGSLATFGAFVFLFCRDKNKQNQIDKLTGIAAILEAQNETMKEQNDLILQQVIIFRNTAVLQGKDQEATVKLLAIEEKKLKLSVKPILWTNGGGYNGSTGDFNIDISNKGETAILLNFINISQDISVTDLQGPYELEKGQSRKIFGTQKGVRHIKDAEININVIYEDRLKNKYCAVIQGVGMVLKIVDTFEMQ